MGRARKNDKTLPKRVYENKGAYYYAPRNSAEQGHKSKWILLCKDRHDVEETLELVKKHPASTMQAVLNGLLRSSKKRARAKNIEHSLTISDINQMFLSTGGRCALSKISLSALGSMSGKFRNPFRPSLDRIENTGGYTAKNCRLVCVAVNIGLNEFGDEVYLKIARGVARNNKKR